MASEGWAYAIANELERTKTELAEWRARALSAEAKVARVEALLNAPFKAAFILNDELREALADPEGPPDV